MKVYHLTYNHQYDPGDYGLFSTKEKAEAFLKDNLGVDVTQVRSYGTNVWTYPRGYRIEEKVVK